MADKRTLNKRNGQIKLLKSYIGKGQEIMANEELSRDPEKELSTLIKNIRLRKTSIDELSEVILNTVNEEDMDEEMQNSSDLDLYVDFELEILVERLQKKMKCSDIRDEEERDQTVRARVYNAEREELFDNKSVISKGSRSSSRAEREELFDNRSVRSKGSRSSSRAEREELFDNRSVRSKNSRSSSPIRSLRGVDDYSRRRNKVRLPVLDVKKFGSDPLAWPEFFEMFKVTVHKNDKLSDVERLSYLKSYVFGEAASCIQGLPLTAGSYVEAVKLLVDRFGNQQLIIDRHMNALLDLSKVPASTQLKELRSLFDHIVVNIRALKAFGISSEQFGQMLSPVIMKMLPDDIKFEVIRRLDNTWTIDELLDVLSKEIKVRESFSNSQRDESRRNVNKKVRDNREQPQYTVESLTVGSRNVQCVFCKGGHYSDKCTMVSEVSARYEFVKKERLCFKCLGTKHGVRTCKAKGKCFSCKSSKHHSALCSPSNMISEPQKTDQNAGNKNNNDGVIKSTPTMINASLSVVNRNPVFLQTIRVVVGNGNGTFYTKANILFDGGSMKTYMTQVFADRLQLTSTKTECISIGSFGDKKGKLTAVDVFPFSLVCSNGEEIGMQGSAVPTICATLDDYRLCVRELKERFHFDDYLPESQMITGDIDILVGGDFYWSIVSRNAIDLTENLVLKPSKVGYLLSGSEHAPSVSCVTTLTSNAVQTSLLSVSRDEEAQVLSTENTSVSEEVSLNEKVQRFWDLDAIGIDVKEKSVCEISEEKIKMGEDGRYEVELPLKENHPMLHDNYFPCVKRLGILQNRLQKEDLLTSYDEIIQQQIVDGIVEIVPDDEERPSFGDVTHIPHRAVVKDDKVTTKVRIVYDCSAKSGGTSLNDCLYKGPCLTPLIFDSLLRFRSNNVALVADIASAYHQISVVGEQRNLLRFLWFRNVVENDYTLQTLRFKRIIFGAAPSQFLLNAVIRKHAQKYNEVDPTFTNIVNRGFYVDDLSTSLNTSAEAIDFYQKCKTRFGDASFDVRKWRTNDPACKRLILEREEKFENLENGKVLGIPWVEKDDMLVIRLSDYIADNESCDKITKRLMLKTVASFYDPPGWIQPAVTKLKILFQAAWKQDLDWDCEITGELAVSWRRVIAELKEVNTIRIPRCYCQNDESNPIVRVDLHGFSDASLAAYGACVYLKFTLKNGDTKTSLVASKSRVAPIKNSQTIPRLELMGNVILARLVEAVTDALKDEIQICNIYCHTDSKISLSWIKGVTKEFQVFVQNRVNEIRRKVPPENWFYVRTDQNPADLLTRADNDGLNERLWWYGPDFLKIADVYSGISNVPGEDEIIEFEKELKVRKQQTLLASAEENPSIDNVIQIEKYSDMLHLIRVTSYVMRFVSNLKKKVQKIELCLTKYPTAGEMKNAHDVWIRANQLSLKEQRGFDQMTVQLNCKIGNDGIVRCYGRMRNANIPESTKAPILLSKVHRLSTLVVLYCHTKVLHRIKQTLCEIRAKYWITNGRSFMKRIVGPCRVCKRLNSRPYSYPGHSDLPSLRFDDRFPFASTGCDYLGPVYVQPIYGDKKKLYKAWIVLYTCTATRAVILDVVNSSNASNFVQSFRRFVARRGSPAQMVSDNGPAFIANETQRYATNSFVDWKFNIPESPWMGGVWERLVSCVKKCLKRTIGRRRVDFVEMQTLVYEIEAILNNRPICNDYEDDVEAVLTPNHLVFGRRLESVNIHHVEPLDDERLDQHLKHLEGMLNYFWKIWRTEYVTSLRESHKSSKTKPEVVSKDDIVLIFDDKQPRHMWKLGRISELIRSKDGAVRAAKVLVGSTGITIDRPISKLYPIETRNT